MIWKVGRKLPRLWNSVTKFIPSLRVAEWETRFNAWSLIFLGDACSAEPTALGVWHMACSFRLHILEVSFLLLLEGPFIQRMVLKLMSIQRHKKVLQTWISYILPHTEGMCSKCLFTGCQTGIQEEQWRCSYCEFIPVKGEWTQMEIFSKKIVVTTLHGLCSSLLLLLCEQPQHTPQSATGCGSRVNNGALTNPF